MEGSTMLTKTNDTRRLTEEEISHEYPDQWLGLTDVEWNADRVCDIDSAVVSFSNMTKNEALKLMSDTRDTKNPVYRYQTIKFDTDYAVLLN